MEYSIVIKNLREKLNLSQEKFAKLFDVSFATINRWEKGRYIPTIEHLEKIKELCKKNNIKFK